MIKFFKISFYIMFFF